MKHDYQARLITCSECSKTWRYGCAECAEQFMAYHRDEFNHEVELRIRDNERRERRRRHRDTQRLTGTRTILPLLTAALVALCGAPAARADNTTYLQRIQHEVGVVYDTGLALSTGYQICSRLGYENGQDTAAWLYQVDDPKYRTEQRAVTWVIIAVEELCPIHDHRLQQAT